MYEKHILIFNKLSNIYDSLGDEIRVTAYHNLSKRLELNDLGGITEKSESKIDEITRTGRLKILDNLEKDKTIKDRIRLVKIIGVGPKQAEKLENQGVNNFREFKKLDNHTKLQKLGIKYFNKLDNPPPSVFKKIKDILTRNLNNLLKLEIAGSYRTGNKNPNDIDLIVCTKTGEIKPILELMKQKKILEDYLHSSENDIFGIIKVKDFFYKIDIKCVLPKYFYSYLLYFGSGKYFSKYIRGLAKQKGYKLNRYGVTNLKTGELKTFRSEEGIFKFLNIPYYTPKERMKFF